MAIFTGTYHRYTAIGLREDLGNIIYNISPEDTPFISSAGKEKANQTLVEWQTDSLAAAVTNNAQLEGDDITDYVTPTPTVRVGNYCQISRKLVAISGTLETVDKAGRRGELAYQLAMKGSELKRDMETAALSNQGGAAGSASAARVSATMGAWLKTNDSLGASGASPVYTSGVPGAARTDGTLRAFTTTILDAVVQSVWTAGGNPKNLFVGPVNKARASAFTSNVTRNFNISNAPAKPSALIAATDVYVSDFGTTRIVASRFQQERDGWILDFDYISIAQLRPMQVHKMAKTGDADKRMMLIEWALKVKNEAALGLAADLTTT